MKWIAAALIAAGAVGAVVAILLVGRSPGAGPLGDQGGGYSGLAPLKTGQIAAMGLPLTQGNNLPIKLLDVHPLPRDTTTGLHLRFAATVGSGLSIGAATGWHTRRWGLRELPFVIPSYEPGGVMVGVSSKTPQSFFLHGFVLDYEVGGTRYSAQQDEGIKGRFR